MKKIILLLLCFMLSINSSLYAQYFRSFQTCTCIDFVWSDWKDQYLDIHTLSGNYHSFCIYSTDYHPSSYLFKFTIDNFSKPDKKTIRQHWRSKTWYEYTGWVEYNISESYPTAEAGLKGYWRMPTVSKGGKGVITKRVRATIKIAPFKRLPNTYNIFYEGVGLGISLKDVTFEYW